MNVPRRLQVARERSGMALDQVEGRTGIFASRLVAFEDGGDEPFVSELAALARLYQREISWFLEEGDPPPDPKVLWCEGKGDA